MAHDYADLGLRIFEHALDYQLYRWHGGAWACSPDGLSQGGYMTCAGDGSASDGALTEFRIRVNRRWHFHAPFVHTNKLLVCLA